MSVESYPSSIPDERFPFLDWTPDQWEAHWQWCRQAAAEVQAELDSLELTLSPDAVPPIGKLQLLAELVPEFARTWQRCRSDFTDSSQSAYDMSIANWCIKMGLSQQETADAIIAHRRIHGQALDKVTVRRDYIERTLRRAGYDHI